MYFQEGYLYHVFNQGNNKRNIFFSQENYLFFLGKIKNHILPYADILAWCLMPNHFHLMVYVRELNIAVDISDKMTPSHRITRLRSLNESISIMLRSYTRAINKQQRTTGSLFRAHTKAKCINCPSGITPSFISIQGITTVFTHPELEYPQVCFNYIHTNPLRAGLVKNATDWEYSSAQDFVGLRAGKLVNFEIAKQYVDW